jgi:hypothetical protein
MEMTVKDALMSVREAAETIKNSDTQRFSEAASVGECWRQGDVYIEVLEGIDSEKHVVDKKPSLQLAPGDTQGSRHILDSDAGVEFFRVENGNALDGPVMRLSQERTITHPEHGNVVLPPGCYGIVYQRAHAEEIRRQMD